MTTPLPGPSTPPGSAQGSASGLYTRPFVALLIVNLLCFSQWFALQPIIPLLVLGLGGDAAVAGLAFAVFSIPSLIFRPVFGQLIDRLGTRPVLASGTLALGLVALGYVFGSLVLVLLLLAIHGVAWAAAMTGGSTLLAQLAPPSRRGEAAASFELMPSLAQLTMPAVGLLAFYSIGRDAVLVGAAALGIIAWFAVVSTAPAPMRTPSAGETRARALTIFEPSAILPMVLALLLMSGMPLFTAFPPILASARGMALSGLAIYYPIYGLVVFSSRLLVSRLLDRLPRAGVITSSGVVAGVAMILAGQAESIELLTVAGAMYAAAAGVSVPVGTAAVIHRSPPDRVGAAMSTYSIGFQLAVGLGAAVWGALIGASGFGFAFGVAAVAQAVLALLAIATRGELDASTDAAWPMKQPTKGR